MTAKKKPTVKETPPIEKPDVESTHTAYTELILMKNPQTDLEFAIAFFIAFLTGFTVGIILTRINDGQKEKEKEKAC